MLKGGGAAAADLPEPGDAGAGLAVGQDAGAVAAQFARQQRARPHDAHVALEHVDQLGQFVNAGAADQLANGGHPRVVGELEVAGQVLHIVLAPAFEQFQHVSPSDRISELTFFHHSTLSLC